MKSAKSKSEWKSLVQDYQNSGLSRNRFCKENNIWPTTFIYLIKNMVLKTRLKRQVEPIAKSLKAWLNKEALNTRSTSKMGKVVSYTLGQWDKIMRYVCCPHLPLDNNSSERIIRHFLLVGKIGYSLEILKEPKPCAFFFSLIETAKANSLCIL